MAEQYEIAKSSEGWEWTLRYDNGRKKAGHDGVFDDRGAAIKGARLHRGDEVVTVIRADGSEEEHLIRGGPERIVLMRGKEVAGEIDHPLTDNTGPAQEVSIQPAGESSEAV